MNKYIGSALWWYYFFSRICLVEQIYIGTMDSAKLGHVNFFKCPYS